MTTATTLECGKRMLEDSLWRACEEDYRQCQADAEAAIAKLRQKCNINPV